MRSEDFGNNFVLENPNVTSGMFRNTGAVTAGKGQVPGGASFAKKGVNDIPRLSLRRSISDQLQTSRIGETVRRET